MAIHSSTRAWKIQWVEEPGMLQSMGSQRVRHDWATSLTLKPSGIREEIKDSSGQNKRGLCILSGKEAKLQEAPDVHRYQQKPSLWPTSVGHFFFFNFWSFVFSFPCKRVQLLKLLIIFQFRYSLYPSIKHRIRPKLSNSSKGWRSLPPPLPHVVPGWSVWNCDFPIQGTHYLEHRECTKSSRISQVVP